MPNLGSVKAIFAQATSPVNTSVLWFDTVNKLYKYFYTPTLTWIPVRRLQLDGALTAGTPTAAEITAVIGLNAVQAGAGFKVTVFNTTDNKLYLIESDGTDWFYKLLTTSFRTTYSNWFLPSKDEFVLIYNNLVQFSIIEMPDGNYWTSSEYYTSADQAWAYMLSRPTFIAIHALKFNNTMYAWPVRKFVSASTYNLRDVGPSGLGFIFHVVDNGDGTYTYYECYYTHLGMCAWSNILINVGTGTAVGTGQANTLAIIAQPGHTASAAKRCNDLVI